MTREKRPPACQHVKSLSLVLKRKTLRSLATRSLETISFLSRMRGRTLLEITGMVFRATMAMVRWCRISEPKQDSQPLTKTIIFSISPRRRRAKADRLSKVTKTRWTCSQ
jgi:hypothetical protein